MNAKERPELKQDISFIDALFDAVRHGVLTTTEATLEWRYYRDKLLEKWNLINGDDERPPYQNENYETLRAVPNEEADIYEYAGVVQDGSRVCDIKGVKPDD